VQLYHLALGAGAQPMDERELRYTYEKNLQVLPTFALVTQTLRETEPKQMVMPGIDLDLWTVLHGGQDITVHRPLPVEGKAIARNRIADVWDKGSAAVIVQDTELVDLDGRPYTTTRSRLFARGAGGFGGNRGPSTHVTIPNRDPDVVVLIPTLPQQPLWYRLCGDWNPAHVDPAFMRAAGFDRPFLHGLCTYGMVCKAVVDAVLDSDVTRVASYSARFAGVVFAGETLRTRIWQESDRLLLTASVVERDDAPALTDATLIPR
jgi:acyl dehydratase